MVKFLVEARRNTFKSPKPDAARLLAFDLLTEVNRNEGYSNLLLPQALNASKMDDRDRSLVTELLYGTIRMQGKHDWVLSQISDRPWPEVDTGIVDICRLGVHQIHEMRIPDHAAVAATVEVARKRIGESKASFVNALLRSVTRKSIDDWFSPLEEIVDPVERLAIRYSHPEWIVSAYYDLLKSWDEVELALKINNEAATPTLVSWPGYSTQQDLIEIEKNIFDNHYNHYAKIVLDDITNQNIYYLNKIFYTATNLIIKMTKLIWLGLITTLACALFFVKLGFLEDAHLIYYDRTHRVDH